MMHRIAIITLLGLLLTSCATVKEFQLSPQRAKADEAFAKGDYLLAATRYESLSDRYPHSPRRERMMMRQGIALYTMGAYHESRRVFLEMLREFPGGEHAEDAKDYIRKTDILMSDNAPAQVEALQQARQDLDQLMALRREHPNDPDVLLAIANLHYEIGDYDSAVRFYAEAQQVDAAYREKALIRDRMRLDEDGNPVPITPDEIEAKRIEENPLVVTNLHEYRARNADEEFLSLKEAFYVVTGQVRNQGRKLVQDVEVQVTFFNSMQQVLDTQTVRIGSLGPGTIRAFQARASSYDNIYNIQDYEVRVISD